MDNKQNYFTPVLRFIQARYDRNFLVSTEGGSSIDDATEEEWTL